jgi:hypothetical protein
MFVVTMSFSKVIRRVPGLYVKLIVRFIYYGNMCA